jgi:A/G-specific adenine glycosylase
LTPDLPALQSAVLAWYAGERRDLPFRGTRDPYLILVSELMAQQTQIARVAEKWSAFVARFPTLEQLAAAPLDEVLRAWAGLGYNRRAVHLHRAARTIVADHGGRVPHEPAVLETLPGVGPYTARAVAAIAFGRSVGAVDTNVRRVLTRLVGRPIAAAELQALADAVVPAGRAADWTAAVMDVGSRHCRPTPRCDGCPARPWCATAGRGDPAPPRLRTRRRAAGSDVPFEATSRWLRGRVVDRLRGASAGGWERFDEPIGGHAVAAVHRAIESLGLEGLIDVDPRDQAVARLARG